MTRDVEPARSRLTNTYTTCMFPADSATTELAGDPHTHGCPVERRPKGPRQTRGRGEGKQGCQLNRDLSAGRKRTPQPAGDEAAGQRRGRRPGGTRLAGPPGSAGLGWRDKNIYKKKKTINNISLYSERPLSTI